MKKPIRLCALIVLVALLALILLSLALFERYGLPGSAIFPLDNPGIVSIPLSFITLIVVSLLTQPSEKETPAVLEATATGDWIRLVNAGPSAMQGGLFFDRAL